MRNCLSVLILDKELKYKTSLMLLRHIILLFKVDVVNWWKNAVQKKVW